MDFTKYWVWLTMVFSAGSMSIWEIMSLYDSPVSAYEDMSGNCEKVRLPERIMKNVRSVSLGQAEAVLENCDCLGIRAIGYNDAEYPPVLRHIFDPPCVLYYRGSIASLTGHPTITAVGTRKATDYSLSVCRHICSELAENDITIVSGFAVGTDITAHLAAASRNRPTVCVMGCGADVDYPKENFRYRDRVIASGGGFITEYPPGTPPRTFNFPKRNRILAALGKATVVFEASAKSGSLITAHLSADIGRDVFCLPPADIFSERYSGNTILLREGAVPLFSSEDILDIFADGGALDREIAEEAELVRDVSFPDAADDEIPEKKDDTAPVLNKKVQRKNKKDYPAPEDTETQPEKAFDGSLPEMQKSIYNILRQGALRTDDIALRLGTDTEELMNDLTEMELSGIVVQLPGNIYKIC